MGFITVLPDALISQIAAGEVVERPASVIKELLENSIDAGATYCAIEVQQDGTKLISVRDNGCGMDAEDARLAFVQHATSKIDSLEDLSAVSSFGFRGEALAAISSVAHVSVTTRVSGAEGGYAVHADAGKVTSHGPTGCAPGTEIVVRNLFFNTPARKKFLKTESTEFSHLLQTVTHIAMSHPRIGFSLTHNGQPVFELPNNSSYVERLSALLGKEVMREAVAVDFETGSLHVYGYVGRPGSAFASKRHQYLFVNGRDVTDSSVARAVIDAYGSRLAARSYPLFVLHIDLDPREVDVNVHPRKLSVKFVEPGNIYRNVLQAVKQSLDEQQLFSTQSSMVTQTGRTDAPVQSTPSLLTQTSLEDRPHNSIDQSQTHLIEPLGYLANSYILMRDGDSLVLVDQHAAHERIMYEKLKKQYQQAQKQTQPLLVPITLHCTHAEAVFIQEALTHLQQLGFECEQWSGNTLAIHAIPAQLDANSIEKIVKQMIEEVMQQQKSSELFNERLLKSLACKSAVTFGMPLSPHEQRQLLTDLQVTTNNATCPHGRPSKIAITFEELERKFMRRK
ncbi:DNA mismatch repair endonuclease MutL [Candidatus Gracilibacteria bacterium]|nr:DNA mismatch repair endonuclease MutL [Candidatus Gracilibacteria bacterium]